MVRNIQQHRRRTAGHSDRWPVRRSLERFRRQVAQRATAGIGDATFRGLSAAGKLHPLSDPARHNVEVVRDLSYLPGGDPAHTLDIYRPSVMRAPLPVVLYVHGGGFRLLSKDTHWIMGLIFARSGFVVCNISYRLAPRHPYPAGLADTCAAYAWVVEKVARYGGDPRRIVVAGESAGGNLVSSLTAATCFRRSESFARDVFELGVVPRATIPFCAILQVSDTARFGRQRQLPSWIDSVLRGIPRSYLRDEQGGGDGVASVRASGVSPAISLADPLLLMESDVEADRTIPPHFLPVGTRDPLLPDTRRMAAALDRRGVPCEARYYPREIHAFQAMVFRQAAQRCWRDAFAFLARYGLAAGSTGEHPGPSPKPATASVIGQSG